MTTQAPPSSPRRIGGVRKSNNTVAAIGICASTGGPPVLQQVFQGLTRPFLIPILLVQHISRGFEDGFARWLSSTTGQAAGIARHGQSLSPGIWLAPAGCHLVLGSQTRLELPAGKTSDIHCPSGNPLFTSMARHLGPHAAGLLLTGMGDDGAEGLLSLKCAGGITIIQEEHSCLIWGMPKAAKQQGAAARELRPSEIVTALNDL